MGNIKWIVDFVEGRISPLEFINEIYTDDSYETFFNDTKSIPPYTTAADTIYLYLIERNFNLIGDVINAQDLLSKYLFSKEIQHTPDNENIKKFNLILKAQPKWLDLRGDYCQYLLKEAGNITGKELTSWLKKTISERFISISVPPKWLQSPNWPIENNQPLLFIGQHDISKIKHDHSQLYIFYSHSRKDFELIEQSL